nr:hypothetical protein [Tanacetum cinerariifolium]
MSFLYLIMNRVGSMVPFVKPLDISKFSCQRVSQRVPRLVVRQIDKALPALPLSMQNQHCLLNVFRFSSTHELKVGEEDLLTLEVPALKNSPYRGPKRRSNSYCDRVILAAKGETFYSWGMGPELS